MVGLVAEVHYSLHSIMTGLWMGRKCLSQGHLRLWLCLGSLPSFSQQSSKQRKKLVSSGFDFSSIERTPVGSGMANAETPRKSLRCPSWKPPFWAVTTMMVHIVTREQPHSPEMWRCEFSDSPPPKKNQASNLSIQQCQSLLRVSTVSSNMKIWALRMALEPF